MEYRGGRKLDTVLLGYPPAVLSIVLVPCQKGFVVTAYLFPDGFTEYVCRAGTVFLEIGVAPGESALYDVDFVIFGQSE